MELSYNLGMVSNMKQFKRGKDFFFFFLKRRRRNKGRVIDRNPGNASREGNTARVVGANREGEKILQIESKWWLSRLDRIRTN